MAKFQFASIIVLAILLFSIPAYAGVWDEPRRGSWLTEAEPVLGDVVLARDGRVCEIVVSSAESSPVQTAARFLAGDIENICGVRPEIVEQPTGDVPAIHLVTSGIGQVPDEISESLVHGAWEEYVVSIGGSEVWLVGSNPRGTAFAAYELSERMGIDPLYHWTNYKPVERNPLALQSGFFIRSGPAFKFRGMSHGAQDILPRPLDDRGYPLQSGVLEIQWYERWFETALRLRCNMVAPYGRVERRYEIQQLASDWGLFYTSQPHDILLSNPWEDQRFALGEARGIGGSYSWDGNKYGMLDFWEGGVVENRKLDCIWPVGLSGTQESGYAWPAGTTQQQKNAAYTEAIGAQMAMVDTILEEDKPRLFYFTLGHNNLDNYQTGGLVVPHDVIRVWQDDGDGQLLGLPEANDQHRHGVYYHLSYLGTTGSKQGPAHTVSPGRISSQFRQIIEAGATEFLMLNVSELRDVVMEMRMVLDIAWRPAAAFNDEQRGHSFINWWAAEYFGQNPEAAASAYRAYYSLLPGYDWQWHGSEYVQLALATLQQKFAAGAYSLQARADLALLLDRKLDLEQGLQVLDRAALNLGQTEGQFFYENVYLALLVEYRHTLCAIKLNEALQEQDIEIAWVLVQAAMVPLATLAEEIKRAERPPFDGWYNHTWIRYRSSAKNIHRPFAQLRNFWLSGGTRMDAEDD